MTYSDDVTFVGNKNAIDKVVEIAKETLGKPHLIVNETKTKIRKIDKTK